jgi:hypothetical protein
MTYRERREARAERLRGWADKRAERAVAASDRVQSLAGVMNGQPILVGHHSESRHRRDIARMDRSMRDSVESSQMAERMRSRADNIERAAEHAIYSDDDDAVERLRARIGGLEAERDRVKAFNASCRKGSPNLDLLDARQRQDYESCLAHSSVFLGAKGQMPAYVLANLSGNISRQRKRLAQLERSAQA